MKSKPKTKIIIFITLGIFFALLPMIVDNPSFITSNSDGINLDTEKVKLSAVLGPIHIDDNEPTKNWSITAATYDWCTGSGTWNHPYIIENITIDGQNVYNCIRIDNSDLYFTIIRI